jgi:hypothetical protein
MIKSRALIYTDASFKNNCGGWSAIIIVNNKQELISGKVASYIKDSGTSEFYAVFKAFQYIRAYYPEVNKICFNTDHQGIVDSLRGKLRNFKPTIRGPTSTAKKLKKMIVFIAKRHKIFIHSNYIKAHQPIIVFKNMIIMNNLKQSVDTLKLIESFKVKKDTLLKNADYIRLRKGGNNRSAILNSIVDAHSKRVRRKYEKSKVL